jgi:hypothetical protein
MRYYSDRTDEHQCDFDVKNRLEKAAQDYHKKWINLRKEVRELVRTQNISITPEFAKLIGLKGDA